MCRRMFPIDAISCHGISGRKARKSSGMSPACLRDDLDCAFETAPKQPVTFKVMKGLVLSIRLSAFAIASRMSSSAGSGLRDIRTRALPIARSRRADADAGCRAWSRQFGAARSIFEQMLNGREIDQREMPRRIVVDEQVDIAVAAQPRPARSNRTDKATSRRAPVRRQRTPSICLSFHLRVMAPFLCRLAATCKWPGRLNSASAWSPDRPAKTSGSRCRTARRQPSPCRSCRS